jgi:vesicle transport protein SEC22
VRGRPICARVESNVEMVKLTLLARVNDGLPLAEGLDASSSAVGPQQDALDALKHQAKQLFKRLGVERGGVGGGVGGSTMGGGVGVGASGVSGGIGASRMTLECGAHCMHYVVDDNVCYLTICDKSYPKKLAYQYLEELREEFSRAHGKDVASVGRPYAFIKFDTFIQRTKKLYSDARTQRNLNKLNDDLHDIQQIMTRNINDVMGQGERLDKVSAMSSNLSVESKRYSKKSKDLARQALIQKYMPLACFFGIVFVTLMLRRYVFNYS